MLLKVHVSESVFSRQDKTQALDGNFVKIVYDHNLSNVNLFITSL